MPRKNTPRGKRSGKSSAASPRWNPQQSRLSLASGAHNPSAVFASAGAAGGLRGHTLADEARNTTKRPRGLFGLDAKLRHRPVVFVSGGLMDPMKELNIPPKEAATAAAPVASMLKEATNTEEPNSPAALMAKAKPNADVAAVGLESQSDNLPIVATEEAALPSTLFVLDTAGDKSLRPKKLENLPVPVTCVDSEVEHESDSSEEVILFKGRGAAFRSAAASKPSSPHPRETRETIDLREMNLEIKVVEESMESIATGESMAQIATNEDITIAVLDSSRPDTPQASAAMVPAPDSPTTKQNESSSFDALLDATLSDEEAAVIADYMANMDNDDEEDDDRDGDGEEPEDNDIHPGLGSHAFHLLRDLGGSDSDAIPGSTTGDESSEDGQVDELMCAEAELAEIHRQRVEKSDERLARLLAKQEELGLSGDDVILYDDAGEEDDQGVWEVAPRTTPRRRKKGSTKQAKIVGQKGQFPSATAMADAFDDLDLMDWHRAALNNAEQKSKRLSRAPEHSDSELEEAMNATFQKDRLKKAEKKRQREALRAQGLLGKNVNPDDLRVKYPIGMSRDELVFELEQFVVGSDEQIIFPPLDKHARKCLHIVASHLKIKSQSSGSGDSRHPVLFRTGRTLRYEERTFDSIVNRSIQRPYFTRVDVDTDVAKSHRAGVRKDTNNSQRKDNAISYREGEVVGQHARELASGNKGRVLLEKMGWSKGMALGTLDNKGIMVPIAHVMKKSRLGLGDV